MLFEGYYIAGRRNGKGKEFYENGKLKYEGEYLNRKKTGFGIEYNNHNGEILLKGEYLRGKKIGKFYKYHYNTRIEL